MSDEARLAALRERIEALPRAPGVYLLQDGQGRVVYVGKAVDLRARVRSYLRPEGDGRAAAPFLARRVAGVDFIATGNEKEALLLENTLIKRHRPRYNVRLRDDKAHLCIRVDTAHAWPRLHMVRRFRRDGAVYFGPFTDAKAVRRTIRTLGAVYPLRLCSDGVLASRSRPCLYYQLKRCGAPCVGYVRPEEYREHVEGMLELLRGRTGPLLETMERAMAEAAEARDYERAAAYRDRIEALRRTTQAQRVAGADLADRDAIGLARRGEVVAAAVLHLREGRLLSLRTHHFPSILPDGAILARLLETVYREGRFVPPEVLLPAEPEDAEALAGTLASRRGGPVRLLAPERGPARALVDLAEQNAIEAIAAAEGDAEQRETLLGKLQERLSLARLPRRIECFDISTIQGASTVGSRVVFLEGLPHKEGYRRFRIRTVPGQDDFASLREVLRRRFAKEEGVPDLVVVDGGGAQLAAVRAAVPAGVALVGLAKARTLEGGGRSPERIFLPDTVAPLALPMDAPETYLLARLRDEAHRFAVAYHRRLRSRSALKSELDAIPGLGPRRRTALLRRFGSARGVRGASRAELEAVPLPTPVVEAILDWAKSSL
ncbi:MAG: excinuclease ABC subunit UvrC [Planctomycetaceae bacterium]